MSLPPIAPPATIGILGGGQLGRMLALAARAMGYRIAVLDPDPDCPAAAVADGQVVAGYDDVGGALRLAGLSDVVTYELEHVGRGGGGSGGARPPVRPGRMPLQVTQDRIAERRFLEEAGVAVAPWREVRTTDDLRHAARRARPAPAAQGRDRRLRRPGPGPPRRDRGRRRRARPAGPPAGRGDAGRGRDRFESELSIVVARGDSMADAPRTRWLATSHDEGILVEIRRAGAPSPPRSPSVPRLIGERLAVAMGLAGTLTAELFLMPDGQLVVNELAPRVHNSGHWTIEGAATSQFEQHIRAICGLELGSTDAARAERDGQPARHRPTRDRPGSSRQASAARWPNPTVHLHLYDKREVFERRKMGHVTAIGSTVG